MLILMVTVLLRTSRSRPPNWSNMALSVAVTSSSYELHLAMDTGAAGASVPAPLSSGVAAISASHSLRVMLLLQSDAGADTDLIEVHAPAFFHRIDLQLLFDAFGSSQGGLFVIAEKMYRDILHRIIRVIHQMHHLGVAAGRFQNVGKHRGHVKQAH